MKKKSRTILLTSFLTFGAIGISTLASCNKKETKFNYTLNLINDNEIGTVTLTNSRGETIDKVNKNDYVFIDVKVIHENYEFKQITVNGVPVEFNNSYNSYAFQVTDFMSEIKVEYNKVYSYVNFNLPENNRGIEEINLYKGLQNEPIEIKNKLRFPVGTELGFKIKFKKYFDVVKFEIDGEKVTTDYENERIDFTLGEKDKTIDVVLAEFSKLGLNLPEGISLKSIKLDGVSKDITSTEYLEKLKIGAKVEIEAELDENYIFIENNSGIFNDEAGYELGDDVASITFDGKNIKIVINELPGGGYSLVLPVRKADKYEYAPFVGTWKPSQSNLSKDINKATIKFDRLGNSTVTFEGYSNMGLNGVVEVEENGVIKVIYDDSSKPLYARYYPLRNEQNESEIVSYLVAFRGAYNDLFVISKDNADINYVSKSYLFSEPEGQNGFRSLIKFTNAKTGFDKWFYFSNSDLLETFVTDETDKNIDKIEENQTFKYSIHDKELTGSLTNNLVDSNHVEVGTYSLDTDSNVKLTLNVDSTYTLGTETGTYVYNAYWRRLILTSTSGVNKTYELNFVKSTFKVFVPVRNALTSTVFKFSPVIHNDLNDTVEYSSPVTFTFIDNKSVHIYQDYQVNDTFEYSLDENGVFYIEFEAVSGYKRISGQFNDKFTKLSFTDGKMSHNNDLKDVVATVEGFNNGVYKSTVEGQEDLILLDETNYKIGTENSTYFIKYNDKDEILVKGEHQYKLNLIDGTYLALPDSANAWFLNTTFYTETIETQMGSDVPVGKEALIIFTNDSKKVAKVEFRYFEHVFGGTEVKYTRENVSYKYDKGNHTIDLNCQGVHVVLIESEKEETLTFKDNFKLFNDWYTFKDFKVKIQSK